MFFYIKQSGHKIIYKGKEYRTPVKLRIRESDVPRLINIMQFKCITGYEIMDSEPVNHLFKKNHSVDKNFIHSGNSPQNIVVSDTKRLERSSKVVKSIRTFTSPNPTNSLFHNSIDDTADENMEIDVDLDGDDILAQLLKNI